MGKEFLSIGEMARISGLTVKALRFYDSIGLLQPHHTDRATNYRYYSKEQLLQADIIKAARSMDIRPGDIKSILKSRDNNVLLDFIDRQKRAAEQKISDLRRVIATTESVKRAIKYSESITCNTGVYFRDIPQRRAAAMRLSKNADERHILSKYTELAGIIEEKKLANMHETGIIFTQSSNKEFHADKIYNTVAADCNEYTPGLESIPEGRFLCVCYNKESAQVQQAKLGKYLNDGKKAPLLMLQADLINDIFDYGNPYFEMQVLL